MMTTEEIKSVLAERFPGAEIAVEDLTGTSDHFEVRITSPLFQGKGLLEQHQMVHQALATPLEDGRIHALKIKTGQK